MLLCIWEAAIFARLLYEVADLSTRCLAGIKGGHPGVRGGLC